MRTDFRDILPPGLLDSARTIRLPNGAYLFRQNDPVHAIYYIKSGQVSLRRPLPDGSSVVNQVAGPGEILAEAALFTEVYHCDAVAMMQSQVIVVAKTAMLNLLVLDSSVALAWMRRLSSQVKGLRQRLEIRDIRPAHSRVRAWLASHDGPEIALDRPLKDIARELGLTHEAFYRTLAALERDGLIQRRKGTITQIDKGI